MLPSATSVHLLASVPDSGSLLLHQRQQGKQPKIYVFFINFCSQRQQAMILAFRNVFLQLDTLNQALSPFLDKVHTLMSGQGAVNHCRRYGGLDANLPAPSPRNSPAHSALGFSELWNQARMRHLILNFWGVTLLPPTCCLPLLIKTFCMTQPIT